MNNHRLYALLLSLMFVVPAIVLPVVGYYSQPLSGDEARLGGYLESDYGWNKPIEVFTPPRYRLARTGYSEYRDVLILGDSFSTRIKVAWPNYFNTLTDYSISVFDINEKSIRDVVNTPGYRQYPPRFVIFETIERLLKNRFMQAATCVNNSIYTAVEGKALPYAESSISVQPDLVFRASGKNIFAYDETFDYLKKYLSRLGGENSTEVSSLSLKKDAPFSSRIKNKLLIMNEEMDLSDYDDAKLKHISCMLGELRGLVEGNGFTRFIVMIVPDKLSAYSGFVADTRLQKKSLIEPLAKHMAEYQLAFPRFDTAVIQAINDGKSDVFLPNDTHVGSEGHKVLASQLFSYMKEQGFIYQAPL